MAVKLSGNLRQRVGRYVDHTVRRNFAWWMSLTLACLAPVCAITTYLLVAGQGPFEDNAGAMRVMFVVDFILALVLLGVIAWRIGKMVIAKRSRSAGSRLHLRMVRLFTFVAVVPALLLGLFGAITVTYTLDGWLNQRVGDVVRNSVTIAEDYVSARHEAIRIDAATIAQAVELSSPLGVPTQAEIAAALREAGNGRPELEIFIIDSSGNLKARSPNSYLFMFTAPDPRHISLASRGGVYVFEDQQSESVKALAQLSGIFDAYLYISRPLDRAALETLSETREMAGRYEQLESDRSDIQIALALLYLGFAVLILSAAIWFGIAFADRLARPIGRLAGAADRVAKGDLSARVEEADGNDEIVTLSRAFNRMTGQVERQRNALLTANDELDHRRRFTEAVLSGVSAGVVGFDPSGRVDLMNAAAADIFETRAMPETLIVFDALLPGSEELIASSRMSESGVAEARLVQVTEYGDREYRARAACQRSENGIEGYVLTLDDMTALISAQRSAAWGDVARRVAHEIRNPLTPIQLSADRLKRKFSEQISDRRDSFDRSVDTIVRQVDQIRRMVDEFSEYARMPSPEMMPVILDELLDESIGLLGVGTNIEFEREPAHSGLIVPCDRGLLAQAITNLLTNSVQSIKRRQAEMPQAPQGQILINTRRDGEEIVIKIEDNGAGLPKQDRARLMEPYVTQRVGGTGLGLAIVDRILQDHCGSVELTDSAKGSGAVAILRLPVTQEMLGPKRHSELGEIPGRSRTVIEAAE